MVDPISLEVFKNLFISVCEEMGVALQRTAYSPNIKERRDFSCALFDPQGKMVAQAAHVPVHLGAMPASVKAAIDGFIGSFRPGDVVILNDPYLGGTHLPDITFVAPVFVGGEEGRQLAGFVSKPGAPRRCRRNDPGFPSTVNRAVPGRYHHPSPEAGPQRQTQPGGGASSSAATLGPPTSGREILPPSSLPSR